MAATSKMSSLFFVGLSFLCLVSVIESFDYFALVQQWPPASCRRTGLFPPCPMPVPKRFTIHGLWPQLNSGALIVNCPGPAFDINKIKGLRNQLNIHWPNVQQRNNNERFWQHEWQRHGTCWTPPNQLRYFQKALDLRKKNNLLKILNGAGLGPSVKNRSGQQIKNALKNKLQGKVEPALRCINVAGGNRQLAEIILCYKTDAVSPINCPPALTNCPPQFLWLPRNSTVLADDHLDDAEDLDDAVAEDLDHANDLDDTDDLTADDLTADDLTADDLTADDLVAKE